MGTFSTYLNYLDKNLLYTARSASVGPMHWGRPGAEKAPIFRRCSVWIGSLSPPVLGASVVHSVSAVCLLRWALGSVLGLFLWAKPQAALLREARQGY